MEEIPAMRKLLVVAAAVLFAACGGGTATPSPAAETPAASTPGGDQPSTAPESTAPELSGSVRVLIHQNPPLVDFLTAFNKTFEANHPGVTVDMSVVNANDLPTSVQTRLTAGDVDVVVPTLTGFSNPVQPYMTNVDPPAWQQLIDAGLLADITDQAFVKNYDPVAIADATTYNSKVYGVDLGRVVYSGIYYNKDLLTQNNISLPTTWSELVAACDTLKAANIPCMTAGGKDGWPVFVGAYGLAGANFPDQAALAQGLWEGSTKWTDSSMAGLFDKYKTYDGSMMEQGASGIAGDAAPGRFASGAVAMFTGGSWYAAAIEAAEPGFDWGYFPFPGSDTAADNQYMFGKYDMVFSLAGNAPNKDAALAWLSDFSDPANYQSFVDAVQFIPTQPTATLGAKIGTELAPFLPNFKVGFEQYWISPKGAGTFAGGPILNNMFTPFGTFDDPQAAATQAQTDLDSGLSAQ
jgi:raffinose/stachyose/melibiose transport system substrate-binding protein